MGVAGLDQHIQLWTRVASTWGMLNLISIFSSAGHSIQCVGVAELDQHIQQLWTQLTSTWGLLNLISIFSTLDTTYQYVGVPELEQHIQ